MNSALKIAASAAAFFIAAPAAALAQNAIMVDDAAMRAGPGRDYPRVAYVPEAARVYLHGCLRGYSWCDISWRGDRGWVDASNIAYIWNNRRVIVEEWGPRIGLPLIAFSVQDYWGRHYRHRSWWNQRHTWFERDRNLRGGERWREQDRSGRIERPRTGGDDWRRQQGGTTDGWRDRQRGSAAGDRNEWRGGQERQLQERQPQQRQLQERQQFQQRPELQDRSDGRQQFQQRQGGQSGIVQQPAREDRVSPRAGRGPDRADQDRGRPDAPGARNQERRGGRD